MSISEIIKLVTGLLIMFSLTGCENINVLEELLQDSDKIISKVIRNKRLYELQILYTKIIRKDGKIKLKTYAYNEKPNKYFYPASTVKFPAAVLALEKLNDMNIDGLNKNTHLSIDSLYEGHVSFPKEYNTECGYPTIANYIKQIFLVSDNESFNRLYDFLGQKEFNERLRIRGFNNTKIVHRLSVARTATQNMETNPINFYNESGTILFTQPPKSEPSDISLELTETLKGIGYYSGGKLIKKPKDFSVNNYFSLRDQHNFLIRVILPEMFNESERFNLTDDDYEFLRKYMSMLPKDSDCPNFRTENYQDSYVKFLMFGDSDDPIPENIKIYNKVGYAYGYITDNAYIVDEKNEIEFFLSATLHVNENQIYNDGEYEYSDIAQPFLSGLGQAIYKYEMMKK